tara:strand:+ start:843 stop:1742 length:900 start_codon:yes stop_codon:yes gene_type:complete
MPNHTNVKQKLIDEFYNNGFVILRNLVDNKKIKKLEDSIKSQIIFHINKHGLNIKDDIYNQGIIQLNKIRKDKANFDSIQVIYNLIRKLPELYNVLGDSNVMDIVRTLSNLDENQSPYIWESFCRIDPPNDSSFDLKWHQESFFTLPNSNSVQLWSPIINNVSIDKTGTVTLLKGSSKLGEIKHYIIKLKNYIHEGIPDNEIDKINLDKTNVELKPGDFLFFHEHAIHKTFHNKGDKVRFTMVANYSNPYTENFKFMSEQEVLMYHKLRTGNASDKENKDYIQSFTSKGGIKDFSSLIN